MTDDIDTYFQGLTRAAVELKRLLSESQIRIGVMEAYFQLIQKNLPGKTVPDKISKILEEGK